MSQSRTTTIKALRLIGIIIIVSLIVGYGIWRSLDYVAGPEITILEPIDGSSIESSTVTIHGNAKRIISIAINGRDISIDENGNWNELIIVFPGINIVQIKAIDRFEREIISKLTLFGRRDLPSGENSSTYSTTTETI
ncbi:MAG: hypothetical protein WC648_03470 [Candidatus Paceibacterota bacterium]|jgi:hypothetical protein